MTVRVRLFAAARAAAGEAEVTAEAGELDTLLTALEDRYGPEFAKVLGVATVLVDGSHAERGEGAVVEDGAEVAILPPFSGG